jgi:hypothetical protein
MQKKIKKNKTYMAKDMGPFRDSQAHSFLRWMYRLKPPLMGPDSKDGSVFSLFNLNFHFQYYSLPTNTYQNRKKMFS